MPDILLINGPNLNLLGTREPELYGSFTLSDLEGSLEESAKEAGFELQSIQSNHEGALVDAVQGAAEAGVKMILINPGAYTHTSIALRDAFLAVQIPFIEVHCSNVHAREPFRQQSYLSDIAAGVISGFHEMSYQMALMAAIAYCAT